MNRFAHALNRTSFFPERSTIKKDSFRGFHSNSLGHDRLDAYKRPKSVSISSEINVRSSIDARNLYFLSSNAGVMKSLTQRVGIAVVRTSNAKNVAVFPVLTDSISVFSNGIRFRFSSRAEGVQTFHRFGSLHGDGVRCVPARLRRQ